MIDDLKIIKKKYNEAMMHLCREMFQTILEKPGLLSTILLDHFTPSRFLYKDIIDNHLEESFKNYIYSFIYKEDVRMQTDVKHPKELLKDAGYVLYECLSEDDIQKFKKYYASREAICTFKGNRLDRCYVFFAVKDNADKLKREQRKLSKRFLVAKKSNKKLSEAKNYQKQRVKVAKIHEKIMNMRTDFLNKLSIYIIKNHDVICIEDLNTKGLLRNHKSQFQYIQ